MASFLPDSRRWRAILVGALLLAIAGSLILWVGRAAEGPEQPIRFSHKIHAGENQIPCLYCHTADRSPSGGVPAVEDCMGCHKVTARNRPEIQKLAGYWDQGAAIPWVRVHDLPDHVRFTHEPHIRAGIECQECHGSVETMERIRQVSSLQMGWCLACHEQKNTSVDCVICHY